MIGALTIFIAMCLRSSPRLGSLDQHGNVIAGTQGVQVHRKAVPISNPDPNPNPDSDSYSRRHPLPLFSEGRYSTYGNKPHLEAFQVGHAYLPGLYV